LCPIIQKISREFPPSRKGAISAPLFKKISELIESCITTDKPNVNFLLMILQNVVDDKGEFFNNCLPSLIKLVQKLAKEHITAAKEAEDAMTMKQQGLALPPSAVPKRAPLKKDSNSLSLSLSLSLMFIFWNTDDLLCTNMSTNSVVIPFLCIE
jgi:hypothetical protein